MIDTVILVEDGFLVPYYCTLETDDTQHIWWDPALLDIQLTGPFCISDMKIQNTAMMFLQERLNPAS